jgi:hypothetical protein
LTTFLFGVVPIRSAGYDPSLDENHDGKIDGKDIALPALIYGTAGDPTVPVNVTNWPTGLTSGNVNVTNWPPTSKIVHYGDAINVSWTNYGSTMGITSGLDYAYQTGFSRMTVQITIYEWKMGAFWTTVALENMIWYILPSSTQAGYTIPSSDSAQTTFYMNNSFVGSDVAAVSSPIVMKAPGYMFEPPYIGSGMASGWLLMNIDIYFRNE